MLATPKKVFISYAHEEGSHPARVLALADSLRGHGIDIILDQYEPNPHQGWPNWMTENLEAADFVLMVCTPAYYRRVMQKEKPGIGLGAQWEGEIIHNLIFKGAKAGAHFIPILLDGASPDTIPSRGAGHTHYRLSSFDLDDHQYDALYRHLTGQPATPPPPVGQVIHRPPISRGTSQSAQNVTSDVAEVKKRAVAESSPVREPVRRRLSTAGVIGLMALVAACAVGGYLGFGRHNRPDPDPVVLPIIVSAKGLRGTSWRNPINTPITRNPGNHKMPEKVVKLNPAGGPVTVTIDPDALHTISYTFVLFASDGQTVLQQRDGFISNQAANTFILTPSPATLNNCTLLWNVGIGTARNSGKAEPYQVIVTLTQGTTQVQGGTIASPPNQGTFTTALQYSDFVRLGQ